MFEKACSARNLAGLVVLLSFVLGAALASMAIAPAARAAVNVERQGAENPVMEVAKSTLYGGLAGLTIGGAIAWAAEGDNGVVVKWSFVGGTFLGLGYGIYHVARRPPPTALLEFGDGSPALRAALPVPGPGRGLTVWLVAVRF